MRKLGIAILVTTLSIEALAGVVAGFAHAFLAWTRECPPAFLPCFCGASAVLWAAFAVRLVWRGPVVTFFRVQVNEEESALVVAPIYPEDVFASMGLPPEHSHDTQPANPPPPVE